MDTNEMEGPHELTLRDEVEAFAARVDTLPLRVAFNDQSHEESRFNFFFAAWPYMTGEYPFHRGVRVSPVPSEPVLPARSAVVRQSIEAHSRRTLIVGTGYVANVVQWDNACLQATICARTDEIAEAIVREFENFRIEQTTDVSFVDVAFTYLGPTGTNRTVRRIGRTAMVRDHPQLCCAGTRRGRRRDGNQRGYGVQGTAVVVPRPAGHGEDNLDPCDRVRMAIVVHNGVRHRSRRTLRSTGVHVRSAARRRRRR